GGTWATPCLLSETALLETAKKGILIPWLPTQMFRSKSKYEKRLSATPVIGPVSSQFSPGEISSIIIAWLVLSIAITYQNFVGLFTGIGSLAIVIAGFVASATGFVMQVVGQ